MRYPIFTIYPTKEHEQIEYTATSPDRNGKVEVYVEVPKKELEWEFAHLTMIIPEGYMKETYGFSESEQREIVGHIKALQSDIMEYITELEKEVHHA